MKLDKQKIFIAMANACINAYEVCEKAEIQYQTFNRITNGSNCKPATVGKIAKALNCDVLELLED